MSPHKSSNLDPGLEQRLRDEARTGGADPSPYLHTRIMAEVSALHGEKMGRSRRRWVGVLGGACAVALVLCVVLAQLGQRTGGTAPVAGIHPPAADFGPVGEDTVALAHELQETVNDPFRSEIESLGSDAKRAAAFLSDCLPL